MALVETRRRRHWVGGLCLRVPVANARLVSWIAQPDAARRRAPPPLNVEISSDTMVVYANPRRCAVVSR